MQIFNCYSGGVVIHCGAQGPKILTIYMSGERSVFFKLYF